MGCPTGDSPRYPNCPRSSAAERRAGSEPHQLLVRVDTARKQVAGPEPRAERHLGLIVHPRILIRILTQESDSCIMYLVLSRTTDA